MLIGVGRRSVIIVGLVRNPLTMVFLSIHVNHMIPRDELFVDWLKQVLLPDVFEAFVCSSIFDKAVFCLGQNKVC